MSTYVPFNKPYMSGRELWRIRQAHTGGHLSGDGPFTKKCEEHLRKKTHCERAFLAHSCTGALEMAAVLCGIEKATRS